MSRTEKGGTHVAKHKYSMRALSGRHGACRTLRPWTWVRAGAALIPQSNSWEGNMTHSFAARTKRAFARSLIAVAVIALPQFCPALTGGPDAFGYRFIDSNESGGPTYNFEDISGTGTSLYLGDDSMSGAVPLGFSFNYYGVSYTSIDISSNGFLTVLAGQYHGCCSGLPSPLAGDPDGIISA
jgi:hypothetical protein